MMPNLITPPTGCRFHPSYPKAMDIGREFQPIPVSATPRTPFVAISVPRGS